MAFAVTFDQFNVSLLNQIISLKTKTKQKQTKNTDFKLLTGIIHV